MDKIDLKKIKEFISEALFFIKDIPLFFIKGKAYFSKIENEKLEINIYRLTSYIILSTALQAAILTPKLNVDYNLLKIAGHYLYQILIMSMGYIAALIFTDVRKKILICLNYIIFQQTITVLVPFAFLACFIVSENYLFYYLYAVSLILFILFVLLYFAWLFNETRLKQLRSIIIILITALSVGYTVSNLGVTTFYNKNLIFAFEDPIASEFFSLNCLEEVSNITSIINVDDAIRVNKVILKLNNIINSESLPDKIEFVLEMENVNKISYNRKINMEKENEKLNNKIKTLEKKLKMAKFNNSKKILNETLEICKGYRDYLNEFDKAIIILSSINEDHPKRLKTKISDNAQQLSSTEAIDIIDKIGNESAKQYYMEKVL